MRFVSLVAFMALLPVFVGATGPALSLSPESGSFVVGDTFTVRVVVDTLGQNVNAVAAYMQYSDDVLHVVSVDTSTSPMDIIVEENYGGGYIDISGGTPTPGFNGIYTLAIIELRAVAAGTGLVSFSSDSAVLLDNGNQNLFQKNEEGATYEIIKAPQLEPQQEFEPVYVYEDPIKTFTSKSLFAAVNTSDITLVKILHLLFDLGF